MGKLSSDSSLGAAAVTRLPVGSQVRRAKPAPRKAGGQETSAVTEGGLTPAQQDAIQGALLRADRILSAQEAKLLHSAAELAAMESELAAFDFIVGRVQHLLALAKEQGAGERKPKKQGHTVAEAAELLGVTAETVREWIKADRLQATKLPGRAGYRITPQAVEAILADGGGRPPTPMAETARLLGTLRRG